MLLNVKFLGPQFEIRLLDLIMFDLQVTGSKTLGKLESDPNSKNKTQMLL